MSFENPSQIIQSWGLTKNFAAGPTTVDKLVPPTYGKIRTPFVQTWREESLGTALDWGNSSPFSYYLPESLRVISSMFLQIKCPAISGHNFKLRWNLCRPSHPVALCWTGNLHLRHAGLLTGLLREFVRRGA